jgi:hypothetical protein
MYGSDTELLGLGGGIHSGKHGSIGRSLIAISLHLHATSHTAQGFATRKIGDVLLTYYSQQQELEQRNKETENKQTSHIPQMYR